MYVLGKTSNGFEKFLFIWFSKLFKGVKSSECIDETFSRRQDPCKERENDMNYSLWNVLTSFLLKGSSASFWKLSKYTAQHNSVQMKDSEFEKHKNLFVGEKKIFFALQRKANEYIQ